MIQTEHFSFGGHLDIPNGPCFAWHIWILIPCYVRITQGCTFQDVQS